MSTIIRTIEDPTPEKVRVGDYLTLRRHTPGGVGVEVRGTVHTWNVIYADYLTLKGWANKRFTIDGEHQMWTVTRIQREEVTASELIPFTTGYATITRGGAERRVWGIFQASRFYPIDIIDGEPYAAASWTDFVAIKP